jgi:hypothetical protein
MKRAAVLGALLVAASISTGCLVQIDHVSDPGSAFRAARAEAARLQGHAGPAHELNVLVFNPDDRELVRVSLPIWMCRKLEGKLDWDDDREARVARSVKRHIRLEQIERAGLGVLAEVEEDDGQQVLIWLK